MKEYHKTIRNILGNRFYQITTAKLIWIPLWFYSGKTYIVLTQKEGLVYKRVYDQINENSTLILHSDNKACHPYEVQLEDVLELWEFTCCINTQEYSKEELKLSSIANMLTNLQVQLKSLG